MSVTARSCWKDCQGLEERLAFCLKRFPFLRFSSFELPAPIEDGRGTRYGHVVVLTTEGLQLIGKVIRPLPSPRRRNPPDLEVRFGNGAGLWVGVSGPGNKLAFEWFCLEAYLATPSRHPDPGSRREMLRLSEQRNLWQPYPVAQEVG